MVQRQGAGAAPRSGLGLGHSVGLPKRVLSLLSPLFTHHQAHGARTIGRGHIQLFKVLRRYARKNDSYGLTRGLHPGSRFDGSGSRR